MTHNETNIWKGACFAFMGLLAVACICFFLALGLVIGERSKVDTCAFSFDTVSDAGQFQFMASKLGKDMYSEVIREPDGSPLVILRTPDRY